MLTLREHKSEFSASPEEKRRWISKLDLAGQVIWDQIATEHQKAEGRTGPCSVFFHLRPPAQQSSGRAAAHKYIMNTYRATVKVTVNGHSQTVKTEVRAPSTQDARWLLWAMYGFHSILSGPTAA